MPTNPTLECVYTYNVCFKIQKKKVYKKKGEERSITFGFVGVVIGSWSLFLPQDILCLEFILNQRNVDLVR